MVLITSHNRHEVKTLHVFTKHKLSKCNGRNKLLGNDGNIYDTAEPAIRCSCKIDCTTDIEVHAEAYVRQKLQSEKQIKNLAPKDRKSNESELPIQQKAVEYKERLSAERSKTSMKESSETIYNSNQKM